MRPEEICWALFILYVLLLALALLTEKDDPTELMDGVDGDNQEANKISQQNNPNQTRTDLP